MEQIKPFKDMTRQEKKTYIWDYYKFHILAVIVGIAIVISVIHHFVTYQAPVANLIMANCPTADTTALDNSFQNFLTSEGYDASKNEVFVHSSIHVDLTGNTTYQSEQTLYMLMATSTYCGFISDEETFKLLKDSGYFCDLGELFSTEELAAYKDDLIYMTDPQTGKEFICGIRLSAKDNAWLSSTETFDSCCLAVMQSDTDLTVVKKLFSYILFEN